MAFRRAVVEAMGGFDTHFGAGSPALSAEETDIVLRLLRAGRRIAWTPEMVVYHPTKDESYHLASRRPYGTGMGSVLRRHRAGAHAARYLVTIGQSLSIALRTRDARRRREALATLRAFLAGVGSSRRPISPERALERIPDELRETLGTAPVHPLPADLGARPRFSYALDGDRLLHVYAGPGGADPEEEILAEAQGRDSYWVLTRRSS
jgi:hypothetical protein